MYIEDSSARGCPDLARSCDTKVVVLVEGTIKFAFSGSSQKEKSNLSRCIRRRTE